MIKNTINPGDCVRIPDGRVGRVREIENGLVRIRVMRATSHTHQFLWLAFSQVVSVPCPKGWMSPQGYNRYLSVTLAKMEDRKRRSK